MSFLAKIIADVCIIMYNFRPLSPAKILLCQGLFKPVTFSIRRRLNYREYSGLITQIRIPTQFSSTPNFFQEFTKHLVELYPQRFYPIAVLSFTPKQAHALY